MKKVLVIALVLFSFALVNGVYAQGGSKLDTAVAAEEIAKATSGTFTGEVVTIDAEANSGVFKTEKYGQREAMLGYAKMDGGYNAAKMLKPGDKVAGNWINVDGTIYILRLMRR